MGKQVCNPQNHYIYHIFKFGTNGHLIVHAKLRKEIGFSDGINVVIETVGGELRVRKMEDVIHNAPEYLKKYFRKTSLS
ncbi:MAG: hypothetical protein OXC82_12320 [Rhodobacteraceae bacterium]|nr:hypothetical protein [Paracoccaceae bacterium]MCY4251202.1 hypothetical protein [Paracoccaceae bacterium]MCY4309342.1 hypothetical protein [Paracoccaceae bacterium]